MVQIVWVPAAGAATTTVGGTATTGYAQILPVWAPEIAMLPATTSVAWQAYIAFATTTVSETKAKRFAMKVACWRNHGGRTYVGFTRETGPESQVTLTYRSVGELVRA